MTSAVVCWWRSMKDSKRRRDTERIQKARSFAVNPPQHRQRYKIKFLSTPVLSCLSLCYLLSSSSSPFSSLLLFLLLLQFCFSFTFDTGIHNSLTAPTGTWSHKKLLIPVSIVLCCFTLFPLLPTNNQINYTHNTHLIHS